MPWLFGDIRCDLQVGDHGGNNIWSLLRNRKPSELRVLILHYWGNDIVRNLTRDLDQMTHEDEMAVRDWCSKAWDLRIEGQYNTQQMSPHLRPNCSTYFGSYSIAEQRITRSVRGHPQGNKTGLSLEKLRGVRVRMFRFSKFAVGRKLNLWGITALTDTTSCQGWCKQRLH